MKRIREFYKRVKESKLKYFMFKFLLIVLFVGLSMNLVNFVVNDLIYKTPKPILKEALESNIFYYILYKGYLPIGIIGILFIIVFDFISIKIKEFKNM